MGCVKSQPSSSIVFKNGKEESSRMNKSKDRNSIINKTENNKGSIIVQTNIRLTGKKSDSEIHQPHVCGSRQKQGNLKKNKINKQIQSKIKAQQKKQQQLIKHDKQSKIEPPKNSNLKITNSNEQNQQKETKQDSFIVFPPSQAIRTSVAERINQNPQSNLFQTICMSDLFKNGASNPNIKPNNYQTKKTDQKSSHSNLKTKQVKNSKCISQANSNTSNTKTDQSSSDLKNNNYQTKHYESYKKNKSNCFKKNENNQSQGYNKHSIF